MTLCWDCCHIKTITCSMPSIFQQTKSFLFLALNQKVVNLHFYVVTAWRHVALSAYYFMTWGPNWIEGRTPLSNLWWIPNSVSVGFGTATKTGSSRRFKRWLSLAFIIDWRVVKRPRLICEEGLRHPLDSDRSLWWNSVKASQKNLPYFHHGQGLSFFCTIFIIAHKTTSNITCF